jgi:dolichol-phosphate mannosyltransferase
LLSLQAGWIELSLIQHLLISLNLALLMIRFGMQLAVASSFDFSNAPGSWAFLLSPLSDFAAVIRIALSASRRPTRWRGRLYAGLS